MGYLGVNTSPIARLIIGRHTSPVFHSVQHLKRIGYQAVRWLVLKLGNKANATGIFLKLFSI